ncbi:MAG: arginase family protein [Candidatus Lokiarchaeota archaeon]|nr:arginase family protein [Candidatus Harpocratesius repetitus]
MIPFTFYDALAGDYQTPTKFALFGIPWDANSTHTHGCPRAAPYKLRELTSFLGRATELEQDITQFNICDFGDIKVLSSKPEQTRKNIIEFINEMLPWNICEPIPVMLGGDHYCTYPVIKALHSRRQEKQEPSFGVIVFDAHLDYYDKWLDEESDFHCTVTKRIADLPNMGVEKVIILGVRDMDIPEIEMAHHDNLKYIPAYKLQNYEQIAAELQKVLQQFQKIGLSEIYVSIDIDVLDGSNTPGTGYSIPGGLTYRQLWNALRFLASHFQIIGFDLVEVAPDLDLPTNLTQITAVKLITEFMGFIIEQTRLNE